MWIVFEALISVYGSARQVEAELAHPIVWQLARRLVRDQFAKDPAQWLPAKPMRRHHYIYGRNRYLADPLILDELAHTHIVSLPPPKHARSGSSTRMVPVRGHIPTSPAWCTPTAR